MSFSRWIPAPSNGERGHARDSTASMVAFSIATKPFVRNVQMHKMKALSNAVLILYSFIDVRTV